MQKKLTNTIELCEYREGEGGYVEKNLSWQKIYFNNNEH